MPIDNFPRYYVLKVPTEDGGTHYVVTEAVIAVNEAKLPEAVRPVLNAELRKAAARKPIEVAELDNPGSEYSSGWLMLQLSTPIPRPGPNPLGGDSISAKVKKPKKG